MNTPLRLKLKNSIQSAIAPLLLTALVATTVDAQDAAPAAAQPAPAPAEASAPPALPPLPEPMNVPKPGPDTGAPYAPQPILPGGVVVTLFPSGSHYLNMTRVHEPEQYGMDRAVPGRISSIVNIHNPSIEVHTVDGQLNTGAAVILAAGGGHNTLNVGSESADFVPFFFNYGVTTIILRNRLRTSGYDPKTDEVYDALQAIKLVRAHAADWHIDPNKIGIMGFSAGAELATAAAVEFADFDQKNDASDNPLAKISSRPDFVGVIYPGPSPYSTANPPPIPRNVPPSFIACAGSGDEQHAMWATDYFTAMLAAHVPNVEIHIYAEGHHPGDKVGPDEPPSTGGLTDRGFIPYGTWQNRFIEWFQNLGFLGKPGVETKAAKDVAAYVSQPPPRGGRGAGGRGRRGGGAGTAAASGAASTAPASSSAAAPQASTPANP
jgi:endo-1,4-beta-xylanase